MNKQASVPKILIEFARSMGTQMKTNRLVIPPKFGDGYCAGFVFNEHIRMLISNYQLNDDLMVINPEINSVNRNIFFKFQNIFPATAISTGRHLLNPSVLIATSRMHTDEIIPIHTNTAVINIEVDANYLRGLLNLPERSPVLHSLLENTQPLFFEQMIYPSLQKIVDEMLTIPADGTFELFFLRVKAEELICRLLMELERRDEQQLYPLNSDDIQTIYQIRDQMLERLDVPPVINKLAISANMSPTKLKRIFRQIFGNSIFSYYQDFRMKEAARLLTEEKLTVSAVGYQLGFTNLSHFSRIFKAHMGMKPKRYSQGS